MKIKINYDFMHKVHGANGKFKLQRKMLENKGVPAFVFGLNIAKYIVTGNTLKMPLFETLTGVMVAHALVSSFYAIMDEKKDVLKSLRELRLLAIKLNNYIKTSGELLIDSQEYHREYELHFSDGRLYLLQKKYIYVPTYNDGTIEYDKVSIVQEHDINLIPPIPSNEYVLSIGTPQKVLKPVFAG